MLKQWQIDAWKALDDWDQFVFVSPSDAANQKKQRILEMARNGEPKPNKRNHSLGIVFGAYTNPNHSGYDPKFDKHIRKLRPDWFVSPSDVANQKKQRLLEMAGNGEPRPNYKKHQLGQALGTYTNPNSGSYDSEFDKQIRKLRTDWFESQSDVANQKKQQLLEMARNGEPRPVQEKHPLGVTLRAYINSNHGCYDSEFDKQIRKLRPDWFISQSDIANQKKQQLLEMARNGEPRPVQEKHPLGSVFCSYIGPKNGSYDAEFDKQIRKLRPDWFISQSDIANQKKQQLLEMAHNGEPRPSHKKHSLGVVFCAYIWPKSGCYDPEFHKQIRNLRPDWFEFQSHGANRKKQQILEMARNGESRPVQKKHSLGVVFCIYTNPNNRSYDPEFDEQIRKLRPDWFKTPLQ